LTATDDGESGPGDQCDDHSDRICHASTSACRESFMAMCDDNRTCIHQDLVCDGIVHCQDASDEQQDICSSCPRSLGFPANKSEHAVDVCTHKYTGLKICTVPCDIEQALCEEDFSARCKWKPVKNQFIFGFCSVLVTILFFELFFYYKQRQGADDQQYEEQPDDLKSVP
jgi:hypothetical protein